jgi:hypothetical protein
MNEDTPVAGIIMPGAEGEEGAGASALLADGDSSALPDLDLQPCL